MPLIKSRTDAAFKKNVAAEINAGKPRDQAAAIAYRVQRDARKKKMSGGGRVGYAPGGKINVGPKAPPFHVRNAARQMERPSGIIASAVPGRSDRIPMSPKGGSYIIPSDAVSAIGQGNTAAGAKGLSQLFKMGPFGAGAAKPPAVTRRGKFAAGGGVEEEPTVDIMAAGGEFLVPPEKVAEIGGGDIERGQNILDDMVMQVRKKHIKTLKNLPGPRQR